MHAGTQEQALPSPAVAPNDSLEAVATTLLQLTSRTS